MEHLFLRTEVFFCSRNILIFFEEKLKYSTEKKGKQRIFGFLTKNQVQILNTPK